VLRRQRLLPAARARTAAARGNVAAFDALRDEGQILSFGVSNLDLPDLEKPWGTAGGSSIVCNQVLWHGYQSQSAV
jgi:diketogulonate reductase-like aldo/keto reductase